MITEHYFDFSLGLPLHPTSQLFCVAGQLFIVVYLKINKPRPSLPLVIQHVANSTKNRLALSKCCLSEVEYGTAVQYGVSKDMYPNDVHWLSLSGACYGQCHH